MIPRTASAILLLTMLLLPVAACGGGGAVDLGGGIGGTGKPGLTVGTVTAVSDLQIGTRTFDTSTAAIAINGQSADEADLRVGMVARVEADVETNVATRVDVEDVIKGPIGSIGADSFTVLGTVIEVDETTVYGPGIAPASLAGLVAGNLVEVYGFVKAAGVVSGRRVERENALSEYRLSGFASGVNTTTRMFSLGTQAVDYSSADTSDLSGGHPAEGQLVRVRALTVLTGAGALDATRVDGQELDDEDDVGDVEVEGFVTAVNSATEFVLGGLTVRTTGATRFDGGTSAEIVAGVGLEVEGALLNGVLTAREVEFRSSVRIESNVESVAGNQITLIALPGLIVTVNSSTEYEGDASMLSDILAGEHVEIRGRATGPSSVTATRIKLEEADQEVRLQGPVDSVPAPADPVFSILGVLVDTTGLPDGAFKDSEEAVIGRAAFFAALQAGRVVEAQGERVGDVAVWDELELEDEDDD